MKNLTKALLLIVGAFTVSLCSTKDVLDSSSSVDMSELYKLEDQAFIDYLIYNASSAVTGDNKLPAGIVVTIQGSSYLNKTKAAEASATLYLVKDNTRITNLTNAGVATAAQKITKLDGIEFLKNIKDIKLTDNEVEGTLDLSALTQLEILEMNRNFVNELILPPSLVRLRYASNSSISNDKKLSSIDLTKNSNLNHLHLPNHNIASDSLKLPTEYGSLVYVDVSGNLGIPFLVPATMYNQLTTREGVEPQVNGSYTGPQPQANYFPVTDVAFGEYLIYLTENTNVDVTIKLLPNTSIKHTDGITYINKQVASQNTTLDIAKSSGKINLMITNGVDENIAKTKLKNADGLEFFTGLTSLTATSNEFNKPLELSALVNLKELTIATAGISYVDVSKNLQLEKIDIRGSTNTNLGKLSAIDLTYNTKLVEVNLNRNSITAENFKLPTSYQNLKKLNMGRNVVNGEEVIYVIPADLYDALTEKEGVRAP